MDKTDFEIIKSLSVYHASVQVEGKWYRSIYYAFEGEARKALELELINLGYRIED